MRYGFIGCGNMGGAVARAVCRGVGPENVVLANRTPAKAEALAEALGCRAATNDVVAQDCDVIFLGVKPQTTLKAVFGRVARNAPPGRFVLAYLAPLPKSPRAIAFGFFILAGARTRTPFSCGKRGSPTAKTRQIASPAA